MWIYWNWRSSLTEVASASLIHRHQDLSSQVSTESPGRSGQDEGTRTLLGKFEDSNLYLEMEWSLPFPESAKRTTVSVLVSLREEGEREMGEQWRKKRRSVKLAFLHILKLFLNNLQQDKPCCFVPWKTNSQSTCFVSWIVFYLLQKSDREAPDRSPLLKTQGG